MKNVYKFLLNTPLNKQWKKIGLKRRAGVIVPLFFIYSKNSLGIGEIPDLKLLIHWCKKTGNSILQLLPLNDTGFNFSPYSLQSSFALDPIYLSLKELKGVKKSSFKRELDTLAERFPLKTFYVNYRIKGEKLKILWKFFLKAQISKEFEKFKEKNKFWLKDYTLFRVLKQSHKEKGWEKWKKPFKNRLKKELKKFKEKHQKEIEFQKWLQWQLFEQLRKVRQYAKSQGIFLKGDLPWLIAEDSADVWSQPNYFQLNFSAGAPPDAFSKKGQRWGMPPLNWEKIFADDFVYFKEKLKYAENFYDLFRIDHVLGIFRIWKISKKSPKILKGLPGFYEPADENLQEEKGRQILLRIIQSTKMLPCAEDLGMVPFCCPRVLRELGIPGIKVQRWAQDYPVLSIATLSTHDTSNYPVYFKGEFKRFPTRIEIGKNLEKINNADSIFCLLFLLEWLFLGDILKGDPQKYRFNIPGLISKKNWSIRMPISLEELLNLSINRQIRKILEKTGRIH
ncbi:MAG: 4-alpha-glucanotransferase [Patescibacteria group bacterium]|nr:4-alpha-glucanotransferase [Patescibacteria group bacterium]